VATYSITLTEDQEVALEYETERQNAARSHQDTGGVVPALLTPAAMLQLMMDQQLQLSAQVVTGVLDPLMAMLAAVSTEGREALIQALPRPSVRRGVRLRLQQQR
jgi:hypothetical protein